MSKNRKETKNKAPFNVLRKGALTAMIGLTVLGGATMMTGCATNGKDGTPGTIWKSGTSYTEFTDAKVGDFFIDIDDYILYQKAETDWLIVMENYGRPGAQGNPGNPGAPAVAPAITINPEGYWCVDGVSTGVKARGENGEPGVTPKVEIKDGFWYINDVKSVKAEAEDGHTPVITISPDGYWEVDGENTLVRATPARIEIIEGYWCIDGDSTGVKAEGKDGSTWISGEVAPTTEGNDGDFYLNETTYNIYKKTDGTWNLIGNIKGENGTVGKGIERVTSVYEFDYATGTEYYVFTFHYTDGTTQEVRTEVPKKIKSVEFIGENQYNLVTDGSDPILKLRVTHDDNTTKEVVIEDEMYVVENDFVKPNFEARGTYDVKVSYRGIITTFEIKVVDPEYVVSIEYSGETRFDVVEVGQEPTITIEATYEDGNTEEIEVTDEMYVVKNLYIKPNFTVAGTYQTQIKYQDATVNVFFTIVDPMAIESMEYISNAQYSMVEAGNEPTLQVKVTFGDGRTETVDITDEMFVVDATHQKPNFQEEGLYNVKIAYQGSELEFAIRVVDPNKATSIVYSGNSIFTTDENPTIKATITLEDGTTKEIEVAEDMYVEDSEHVKPDFSVSATYKVKIFYQDVTTSTLTFYVVDPVEGVLVSSDEFVAGSYYDITKNDPTNKDKLTSADYGRGKTFDKLLTTQDILVKIENADFSKQYNVTTSTFDSEGNYKSRGGIVKVYNGEIALKASEIGGTHFRLTTYIYPPFAAMPEGVKITIYKMPEKATSNIPEKEPEDVILSTEDFVYGTRYDDAEINTTGSHIQCKASTSLIDKRDILIKVVSEGTDFTNYKVILSYHNESGAKTGKSDTLKMTNGELEILASSLPANVAKIGITILDWGSGFTKIPEEAKIYVTKKPTTTSWEGKTISIIGDSISVGGYPSTLGSLTGATIDNNAVSGTNLAGNGGLVAQLPNIDENSDLVIVFGGTNDYWHKNVTIGTIEDEGTGTFYGSLKHILNYLQTSHSDAQYLFVFPFDQHFSGSQSSEDFGKGSLDDFRAAFINFCTVNNLEYVDLGTTEFDHNAHTSDGVHPNSAGHYIIAEAIKDAITNNFYN